MNVDDLKLHSKPPSFSFDAPEFAKRMDRCMSIRAIQASLAGMESAVGEEDVEKALCRALDKVQDALADVEWIALQALGAYIVDEARAARGTCHAGQAE